METILIVDDNEKLLGLMKGRFSSDGYDVITATNLGDALGVIEEREVSVVILDLRLKDESGLEGLPTFLKADALLQVIIVTGYATVPTAVQAMRDGAYDYIQKPVDSNVLRKTIEKAIRFRNLSKENSYLRGQLLNTSYCLRSNSPVMLDLIEKATKLSTTDLPVLLVGESGTGKEVFADFIHSKSRRGEKPLVKVNSSAFSESLLENELFGHEKHAFTGAESTYKGLFEQANTGTLFLDEIGDMSLSIQAKILRALQNSEVRRIGGSKTITVDVRMVAATNKDLGELMDAKEFREDLYYRINTAVLHVPPLREHIEDVPILVEHFLGKTSVHDSNYPQVHKRVMDILLGYHWPGNTRELKNVIQYSTAMANGSTIDFEHLPPFLRETPAYTSGYPGRRNGLDRRTISAVLEKARYNKKRAAELLGISRKTLYEKLKKFEIEY